MKIDKEMFARWDKHVRYFLAEYQAGPSDIKTPVAAWNVAHRLDIPKEAYHVGCNDKHIETALKRLFPLAWSK